MIGKTISNKGDLMSFERFDNKWEIRGTIEMETPLRIGKTTAEYSLSSAPILLQYNAKSKEYLPFIPGSSLKGVIRSVSERITRTFGMGTCIVTHKEGPCGNCIVCRIFGSMSEGAKIRVRDCNVISEGVQHSLTESRPHFAGKYSSNRQTGMYNIEHNRWGFRDEEEVAPLNFELNIELDNTNEEEMALVLTALDEFNYKRAHLGGGVSRGLGFASVKIEEIVKKSLDGLKPVGEQLSRDSFEFKPSTTAKIQDTDTFDAYYNAHDNSLSGYIACEMTANCLSDFILRGIDEETVTAGGSPVIPGSVIKGFLKRHFSKFWDIRKIDDIFGSANPKFGHRSRFLISDSFSEDVTTSNKIPQGSKLKCWVVFDNIREGDIREIVEAMNKPNIISGNISAKGYQQKGIKRFNKVEFQIMKAWKFTVNDIGLDVTDRL
jgi:CRISPR/Cas system CSM-associated protein Csm3 (group 7 of RAMP superfamily)